jgi:photosystem II stability/assembly factor-like uncharacterized protein
MAFAAYEVPVIERERGWGSKVDDYMLCLTMEDAKAWAKEFNSKNPPGPAPDWYMQAEDQSIQLVEVTGTQLKIIETSRDGRMWRSELACLK